ncbi:metal-dependent transcriptional regulator [Haloarcula laminariae]|uniref:metal-dependent transcriptional regulator n=1 Tax=Haloarcula laminariae TaxID=2961577 RepID=UPI0021C90A7F|nr:metal-dependent transcriptional regulator [Halomicroarcula laminariae]
MSSEPDPRPSASRPQSLADTERGIARYLFAISVLSGPDSDRVTTGELQEYLNVAPASATEMVAKLDERGLVEYEKYQGVQLTDRGGALASAAGWRFCVVSTFFESVLDMTVADQTAFDIGYALPKDGVSRLRALVDSACLELCPTADDGSEPCVA